MNPHCLRKNVNFSILLFFLFYEWILCTNYYSRLFRVVFRWIWLELEYEVLSAGLANPFDETEHGWVSALPLDSWVSIPPNNHVTECDHEDGTKYEKAVAVLNIKCCIAGWDCQWSSTQSAGVWKFRGFGTVALKMASIFWGRQWWSRGH